MFHVSRWPGIALLLIGYPLVAYYTTKLNHHDTLGAVIAITPLLLLALVLVWHSRQRVVMAGALGLVCAALWAARSVLTQHVGMVYWLQYVGMQLLLSITFARTLLAGRQPLCTQFAEALHPPLTPQQKQYTRQVTIAWSLFFAAMALTSTLLFFLGPVMSWSVFDHFLTLPLIALMFIGEYWVRRRALPDMQHVHILDAVRAFRNTSAQPRK